MKKNVASQTVGAQMVAAADGSAFTAAVSCFVTGDAGAQGAGAGAVTHEGNGYHSYAPSQAETNFDHVAFTFTGTGAIPATVQVYTEFPQTGDGFARLGAPAGASVSADVAAIKAETATILADTNDIQTRLPAALVGGRMDSSVGAMAANTLTAAATAADFTTEIQAGLALSTQVDALEGDTTTLLGRLTAIRAGNLDNLDATVSSRLATAGYTVPPTANENADGLLSRNVSGGSSAGRTVKQALHVLRNKTDIAGGTLTVYDTDDSTASFTATVTTAAGNPITTIDPA